MMHSQKNIKLQFIKPTEIWQYQKVQWLNYSHKNFHQNIYGTLWVKDVQRRQFMTFGKLRDITNYGS